MNNIAIWGTGLLGEVAYYYYKDRSNIICYIDNDQRKWGEVLNGIRICSPNILFDYEVKVVLAMKNGIEEVKEQLYKNYGIYYSILFRIDEEIESNVEEKFSEIKRNTCIISFSGGLGNQMFQYAFLRALEVHGKNVVADFGLEKDIKKIQILNTFKNIKLSICTNKQKNQIIMENIESKNRAKKFLFFSEANIYEVNSKEADLSILDITGGVIVGLYQTYKFASKIKDVLLEDFRFDFNCEKKLKLLQERILGQKTVSIHIRRGDYLLGNNKWIYGDICTERYYKNAIEYMRQRIKDCVFYVFSNDIEWTKENYNIENAIYIDKSMFENYQDWYDMYLMSICKHNIIANSTFSWWGAWLNRNPDKIVIAPERWVNICDYKDIYPQDWITM